MESTSELRRAGHHVARIVLAFYYGLVGNDAVGAALASTGIGVLALLAITHDPLRQLSQMSEETDEAADPCSPLAG